jgi:protein-tyrosine phosphatase
LAAELQPIFDKTQFKYKVVKISNDVSENISKHFDQVYQFIRDALVCGDSVLIHDFSGTQRAPTFAAAFLVKH